MFAVTKYNVKVRISKGDREGDRVEDREIERIGDCNCVETYWWNHTQCRRVGMDIEHKL